MKFLSPSGKYGIELYDGFLRMQGSKYDFKVKYTDISRLFLLNRPDGRAFFIVALEKAIRQGQQRHSYLVLQVDKSDSSVTLNLDEEARNKSGMKDEQVRVVIRFVSKSVSLYICASISLAVRTPITSNARPTLRMH